MVSGQEREETGKSLRRTLEDGELRREDAEDRGVSIKLEESSCWQLMEVGTT